MKTTNTGGTVLFTFLAWLLALTGPIISLWLLIRGILRLLPTLIVGAIPGAVGDILADYTAAAAALPDAFELWGLIVRLFSEAAGGVSSFIIGILLPLPGLLLVPFFALSLQRKYIFARVILVFKLCLYGGSGLLCYLAVSRLTNAIGILESPFSFAPHVILALTALACMFLFAAYVRIVRLREFAKISTI